MTTDPTYLSSTCRYLKLIAGAAILYGAVEVIVWGLRLAPGWIVEYADPEYVSVAGSAVRSLALVLAALGIVALACHKAINAPWPVRALAVVFAIALACAPSEIASAFIVEELRAAMAGIGLGGEGPQDWGIWTGPRIIGIVGVTLLAFSARRVVLGRVAKAGRSWIIVLCCGWILWHLAWEALNQWTFTWEGEPSRPQWQMMHLSLLGLRASKLLFIALTVAALLGFRSRI